MKWKGIKKVVTESKSLNKYGLGGYLQINIDRKSHEVWADYFPDYCVGNSWNVYHSDNIEKVGYISVPTTMKKLTEMIERHEKKVQEMNNFFAKYEEMVKNEEKYEEGEWW